MRIDGNRSLKIIFFGVVALSVNGACAPVRTNFQKGQLAATQTLKESQMTACATLHCASNPNNKEFYANVSAKAFDRGRTNSAIR